MILTQRQRIDEDWRFQRGDLAGAQDPSCDDSGWEIVRVPHDWGAATPAQEGQPSTHGKPRYAGYVATGVGWYRKRLDLRAEAAGRRVYVEFEGVFRNSTLWVNGREVGTHPCGYTGVVWDITGHVQPGQANVLALRVDASRREGWWYEGCGIYRHVWLMEVAPVHVVPWGTFVTTPEVTPAQAVVHVRATVRNETPRQEIVRLETVLRDPQGREVARGTSEVLLPPGAARDEGQQFHVETPALWAPETPNLYAAETTVICAGETGDAARTVFGIRWFEFAPDRGFLLNGQRVELRGMNVHHDWGGLGVALPDRANEKTVEVIKAMGGNFLRSSHNDAAPSLLDACDRLGLLVWAETRYLSETDDAVPALRALIRRSRNHPSIICWGLANTAGSVDGRLTECLRQLHLVAHEEDPTRPTAAALEGNCDPNANGFAFIADVVGYNGGGLKDDLYLKDHERFPQRRLLISEYSSGRGARGVYEERAHAEATLERYEDGRLLRHAGQYCSIYDLCRSHEIEWARVARSPWLAGGAMWSGIEYRGESVGWPIVTSQFGVLDVCRFPKDAYYFYLQEWTTAPMVHVFPHWTWPGSEGRMIDLWGYTNCETVKLFCNDRSLGVRERAPLGHVAWQAPYEPGVLRAEGRRDGRVVCRQEVRTAGEPAGLALRADRTTIRPDGSDLCFLTVEVLDASGVPVPTAEAPVQVEVRGPGRVLGLASGDPGSHAPPSTNPMPTFSGLLLAMVQSHDRSGPISVRAASPGLREANMTVEAR